MGNKWVSRKKLEKDMKRGIIYALSSIKCKHCGHPQLVGRKDRIICRWCGNYIFKDDKIEFEYRLKERMINLI